MTDNNEWYRGYQQTDGDKAEIAEFFEDEKRRALSWGKPTDTVSHRRPAPPPQPKVTYQWVVAPEQFPKACRCCGLVYLSDVTWWHLSHIGLQRDEGYPILDFRNCRCGSTLAAELLLVEQAS